MWPSPSQSYNESNHGEQPQPESGVVCGNAYELGTLTRKEDQTKFLGVITANVDGIHVKLAGSSKANLLTGRRKVVVHFRPVILIKGSNLLRLSSTHYGTTRQTVQTPRVSNPFLLYSNKSKLAQDINCQTNFFRSHCVFQDLNSGKMIGSAKESGGLYYLDIGSASQLPSKTISSYFESFSVLNNKDDNIMG
ncbi:hypothetical protein KIW84_072959 [Lathyrus oleraceus]|uniref:Uncharacterized protein n=1 Tax=Pisum sativum TaxID=3888 RepID=A0A9D4VMC6_PEA|nr:hypothetical protein KIW84_072959 [Pisum sativum]